MPKKYNCKENITRQIFVPAGDRITVDATWRLISLSACPDASYRGPMEPRDPMTSGEVSFWIQPYRSEAREIHRISATSLMDAWMAQKQAPQLLEEWLKYQQRVISPEASNVLATMERFISPAPFLPVIYPYGAELWFERCAATCDTGGDNPRMHEPLFFEARFIVTRDVAL